MAAIRRTGGNRRAAWGSSRGFTLVELLVVIVIIAALVLIALPRYFQAVHSAWVRACQSQIKIIETATQAFFSRNHVWPTEVEQLVRGKAPAWVMGVPLDGMPECPFGVPYQLVPIRQDGSVGQPTGDNPQVGVTVNAADHFEGGQWINAVQHR